MINASLAVGIVRAIGPAWSMKAKQVGIRMSSSPARPSGWPEMKFNVN